MNTAIIIQARMSSTRLPGKVMLSVEGKPLLWYVVNRCRWSQKTDGIIIATTTQSSDDIIEYFCKKNKIACFRGSLDDVLDRYYQAAKKFKVRTIVRVTSDCPLIDGKLIDKGLIEFHKNNHDYLSNTVKRTYPRGFDFEIFKFPALEEAHKKAKEAPEHEHVTPYIWRNHPNNFKIGHYFQSDDAARFRITVDTFEDFQAIELLIQTYHANTKGYAAIIQTLRRYPRISKLNAHIEQKLYGK